MDFNTCITIYIFYEYTVLLVICYKSTNCGNKLIFNIKCIVLDLERYYS